MQSLCNCFGSWKAKDAYLPTHKACSVVTLTQCHHRLVWTQCFSPPKHHVRFFLDIRIRCSELSCYVWSALNSTCHRPPSLCLCFVSVLVPRALARTWETFRLLPKHPWLQMLNQLLPGKHGKRMQDELEMQWAGGSVPPAHSQKQSPGESSSPSSQDCVASNSVRKAYSVLEWGLFRDPCCGCSNSLSFFPCKSCIPFWLQHEAEESWWCSTPVAPRQYTPGRGRYLTL